MLLNRQISSCIDVLESYHRLYNWIPGKNSIRPTILQIQLKKNLLNNIIEKYQSSRDYILIEIFNLSFIKNIEGKYKANEIKNISLSKFSCCKFRYNIDPNTFHYIMWFTDDKQNLTESKINKYINQSIYNIIQSYNFTFIWYENPKMTITDIYHIQVFWVKT